MGKERGRHNGLWLSVHFMDSSLQKLQICSMTKAAIGSYPRLPSKLRGVLKSLGKMN